MEEQIQQSYGIKSEIDHVLDRSGMWVGSITNNLREYPLFVPSKNKIEVLPNIAYNAGLLKLIDEILSNSIDEYKRKNKGALFNITTINVTINNNGHCIIEDDGGITISIHKDTGILIPELIFGHLRTSSNYDDTQEREGVGTNGLGSKLTNIFSKNFSVQTCDGKNSVCIEWSNNMKTSNKDLEKYPNIGFEITKTDKHYTKSTFDIDLERFELESMGLSTIRIIQKRCIDAAASNPGLIINFNSDVVDGKLNSVWQFSSFEEYVKLYLNENQTKSIIKYINKKDTIILIPENLGFNFGFVNSGICSTGTHMEKLEKQITNKLLDYCAKNEMELITSKDILNRMSIFVNTTIINPKYDSQTKEKLTNKIDKFILNFSVDFLESLETSEIMKSLRDFYEIKYAEQKRKELRKLNESIKNTKSKKLISSASKSPDMNELWLFEGTSASNGFRNNRNLFQSAYLLRGKIKNTFNLERNQIIENIELRELLAICGLLFNEPKKNIENFKFNKLVIASDMDNDGNHICGLFIAFFAKFFPELFKAGKIYRALSPIIVCNPEKKNLEKLYFYNISEYEKVEKSLKGYEIIYTKGLGGLSDDDYKVMLRQQKLIKFDYDKLRDLEFINIWFAKSTEMRKQLILEDDEMVA
jgi:DNA gyrase/topoisomerase IV subunit B